MCSLRDRGTRRDSDSRFPSREKLHEKEGKIGVPGCPSVPVGNRDDIAEWVFFVNPRQLRAKGVRYLRLGMAVGCGRKLRRRPGLVAYGRRRHWKPYPALAVTPVLFLHDDDSWRGGMEPCEAVELDEILRIYP